MAQLRALIQTGTTNKLTSQINAQEEAANSPQQLSTLGKQSNAALQSLMDEVATKSDRLASVERQLVNSKSENDRMLAHNKQLTEMLQSSDDERAQLRIRRGPDHAARRRAVRGCRAHVLGCAAQDPGDSEVTGELWGLESPGLKSHTDA